MEMERTLWDEPLLGAGILPLRPMVFGLAKKKWVSEGQEDGEERHSPSTRRMYGWLRVTELDNFALCFDDLWTSMCVFSGGGGC